MTDDSVIDANCWCEYVDESIRGTESRGRATYSIAQKIGSIIFDLDNLIRQQYLQSKRGFGEELFDSFFERGVLAGTIRVVELTRSRQIQSVLKGLGVPRSEHVYFHVACIGTAKYIVSEDIDFFDPTLKQSREAAKQKVKRNASGCVCKAFRHSHSINIRTMDTFIAELGS